MILLSNTIGSAKESVAGVRKEMASLRGGDWNCEWQLSLSSKALGFNLEVKGRTDDI